MKSLFVFCVLFGISSQALGAILGADRCTWGPSYWCKNIGTANECGAIQHCKTQQWNQRVKDSTVCSICKDGMNLVDGYLEKNGTKQEIEQALMQICGDLPASLAQLKQECKQLVSEDFDMIYDEVLSIIGNADAMCQALGLCSAAEVQDDSVDALINRLPALVKEAIKNDAIPKAVPHIVDQLVEQPANKDCSDCQAFLKEVQNAVKTDSSIKDKWMKLVEAECKALGPGIDELCTETVNEALTIFSELNGDDDVNSMCKAMMMCNMKSHSVSSDAGMCTDCKNFFDDWKNLIMHNKTIVVQLNKLILMECQALGSLDKLNEIVNKLAGFYCLQKPSYMRPRCTRYVSMVIEVSLNRIAHESSQEICQEIYFCEPQMAGQVQLSMDKEQEGVSDDKYCKDCTTFMADLQGVAKNNQSIIDDLTDLIKEQCDALGPDIAAVCKAQVSSVIPLFESLCKKAADQIIPMVVDAIESNDVNLICTTILMCPAGSHNTPMTGNLCNDCIAFTEDWQAIAANNKSIITGLLDLAKSAYCNQYPPQMQQQCLQVASNLVQQLLSALAGNCSTFVKEYLPSLWDLIEDNDAGTICSTIYLCLDEDKPKPVVEEAVDAVVPVQVEGVSDDKYCTDCAQFMKDLQDAAKNNQSIVTDITNLVEEQCDTLGPELSGLCKLEVPNLLKSNLPKFEDADVNTICATLLMCPAGSSKNPMVGNLCNDCVAFTEDWQAIIQNNKSIIDELTSMITQQCSALGPDFEKLPGLVQQIDQLVCSKIEFFEQECRNEVTKLEAQVVAQLKAKCSSFVKDYLPQLWDLIQYNDAETICGTMYMCMDAKAEEKAVDTVQNAIRTSMEVATDEGNVVTCTLCKVVIHELDKMLQGNTTEAAVVDALEKVCKLFSEDIRSECMSFVKTYGADIVDLIINEVESGAICGRLALCATRKQQVVKASTECEICEAVAQELENLLSDASTEDEIISAVEKVCSLLPQADQAECKSLIDEYGKLIIGLLVKEFNPQTLCSDLGLCTSSVAKKQVKDDTTCELCELVANELDSILTDKSTEDEIIKAVEKVCSILPQADQAECKSLIDEYGKMIIQLLTSKFSPKTLCTDLGLCTKAQNAQVAAVNSDDCQICELVAQELEQLVTKNSTEEEIIKAVEKVCSLLPSDLKQECDALIDLYGPDIINMLLKKVTPQEICTTIKLCTSKVAAVNSDNCQICELVAQELEQLVTKNSTEEEIIKAVEKVCSLLPTNLKQECDALIDMYGPDIINMLLKKVTPQEICTTLKLCTSKVLLGTTCELCDIVMQELDHWLDSESTDEEIVAAVEKVCTLIPAQYQNQCDGLIEEYGATVIQLLVSLVPPSEICSSLGLCSKAAVVAANNKYEYCEICKLAMTELDNLLSENSTEAEITTALEKVCTLLPGDLKSQCDDFMASNLKPILDLLLSEISPSKVCPYLGLCPSKLSALVKRDARSEHYCDVCKIVVEYFDNALPDKPSSDDKQTTLDKVCSIVPASSYGTCDDLVIEHGHSIIDLSDHVFDPDYVCLAAGLCDARKRSLVGDNPCTYGPSYWCQNEQTAAECNVKKDTASGELCDVCKIVIQFLDQEISANATEAEIEAALDEVCAKLPSELRQSCDDLVKQYADDILGMLANIFDPDYVCLHLGLCGNAVKKQVLIGANPCTYGPAYWCQNEQTARECNALQHCQQHIWE